MAAGSLLALTCIVLFVSRGRGTPALFDAPRRFVAAGPYQYVRNPMYLGGLLLLAGFGLWLRSPSVLVMAAMMFLAVHLVVILHEEPALRKRFAGSYVEYSGSERRWIPGKARTALRGHSRDTRP